MKTCLILVDIQNDFCPGGALAVPDGDAVVAIANRLQSQYDVVVATQDWHPANHGSFAVNNPGRKPFEMGELGGLPQVLWPAHCVQGTTGAAFHPRLGQHQLMVAVLGQLAHHLGVFAADRERNPRRIQRQPHGLGDPCLVNAPGTFLNEERGGDSIWEPSLSQEALPSLGIGREDGRPFPPGPHPRGQDGLQGNRDALHRQRDERGIQRRRHGLAHRLP